MVCHSYLNRTLKLAEKLVGVDSPELVPICNNLGAVHVGLDEMDMAVVYYQRALGILRAIFSGVRMWMWLCITRRVLFCVSFGSLLSSFVPLRRLARGITDDARVRVCLPACLRACGYD